MFGLLTRDVQVFKSVDFVMYYYQVCQLWFNGKASVEFCLVSFLTLTVPRFIKFCLKIKVATIIKKSLD